MEVMNGEDLSLDNILIGNDLENLFEEESTQETETPENETEDNETTEVNVEDLFADKPESVGSEDKDNEEKEDTNSNKGGTSPNLFSSIATALREEGIFPDLDDETINKVDGAESFRDLVEQQIQAGLDEVQKRVNDALNVGIEPTVIQQYEQTLSYLDSIEESSITDEGEKGEELRKKLIYQDFLNRGFSKERATRELEKSFKAGTDIEDAKEALKGNKDFFQSSYDKLIKDAKDEEAREVKKRKEQAESLKKTILEDKKVFGDMEIDKSTRQRVYDNIAKPVFKDPETGEYLTAIQKYEMENRTEFLKNVGLLFTLTDGFKNLDGLVKGKVRKEVKKGLRELEHTLNNTSRTSDGNLKFASGVDDDPESFIGKGWDLDV